MVSLRYKEGEKVFNWKNLGGRSHCPICQKQLVWYELIPLISFLIQRGKCRHCGHKIVLQYPIIELLSALNFSLVPWYLFNFQFSILNFQFWQSPSLINLTAIIIVVIWILIFSLFLLLSSIDYRLSIIPDSISFYLGILGLILIVAEIFQFSLSKGSFVGQYASMFGLYFYKNVLVSHIFAAVIGGLFFSLIIILSRGRAMGWGDAKLAVVLGLIFGWPDIIFVLFFAFIIGTIFLIPLLAMGRKKMKEAIPFGPFLIIGATFIFFFGVKFFEFYFKLCAL